MAYTITTRNDNDSLLNLISDYIGIPKCEVEEFRLELLSPETEENENSTGGKQKDIKQRRVIAECCYHIRLKENRMDCPHCQSDHVRLHGYRKKNITYNLMAGRKTTIVFHQRRWQCQSCRKTWSEYDPFTSRREKVALETVDNIMRDLQSPEATFTSVGRKYGLSNTTIIRIFDTRVELSRLPLSPYICIDENYAIREGNSKYVCVLVDFETQDVIDVLPNRFKADLRRYFLSIPEPERMKVKAVGIDMYETYRDIVTQCFPSSTKVAIDRFHLVKEFTKQADTVRKDVTGRIKRERDSLKRQKDKLKESPVFLSQPVQREYRKVKDKHWKRCSEYYLLKKYNWFLFKDPGDDLFDVNRKKHYNSHFHEYLNYSDLKTKMYSLIPSMSEIERFRVHLSELYTYKTAEDAAGCLDKLIKELESCQIKEMKHFAGTLKRWRIEILNSVTVLTQIYEVQTDGDVIIRDRRLNNGVIERKNKQIKVIKNVANGYSNFDRFRNRILYCLRSNPSFSYEKTYASKARKGIKRRAAG